MWGKNWLVVVVVVVVVDPQQILTVAIGILSSYLSDYREKLISEVELCSKRASLHGFEIPKAIYVETEMFSEKSGLLTPTQKLKRVGARDRYQPILDDLYRQLDDEEAAKNRSRL